MVLGVGWALLDVLAGDNRPHRHLAHQVSLALNDPVAIGGTRSLQLSAGEAAAVPAGTLHSLGPAGSAVRTVYVDPRFGGRRDLLERPEPFRLPPSQAAALRAVRSGAEAKEWIADFLGTSSASSIDSRLQFALAEIDPGTSATELAQTLGLSRVRLRELVSRDFGFPTVKLLQWLQLQHAIDALRHSASLADAAAAGGFSDQAHFNRRLVEWFGVTPSLGLAQLEISIVR